MYSWSDKKKQQRGGSLLEAALATTILATLALLALAGAPAAQTCNPREPTRETDPGPHDFSTAPADGALWKEGDAGEPLFLHLRVLDLDLQDHLTQGRLEGRRRHEPGRRRLLLGNSRCGDRPQNRQAGDGSRSHPAGPPANPASSAWARTGSRTVTLCRSISRCRSSATADSSE